MADCSCFLLVVDCLLFIVFVVVDCRLLFFAVMDLILIALLPRIYCNDSSTSAASTNYQRCFCFFLHDDVGVCCVLVTVNSYVFIMLLSGHILHQTKQSCQ